VEEVESALMILVGGEMDDGRIRRGWLLGEECDGEYGDKH
jgi:hypothetical protein